jgi:quercetin 2,3-dioxygenase
VHFLQIWILPNVSGIEPGYEEKHFSEAEKRGRLRLIASPDGRDGSVKIHQDACVYTAVLDGEDAVTHTLGQGRKAYVHVALGTVTVNGHALSGGDGARIVDERSLALSKARGAEILLFDLA